MKSIYADGFSMLPSISPGARLQVEEISFTEIMVGDIVCYLNVNKSLVAHRVIKVNFNKGNVTFVVRGDAQRFTEVLEPSAVAMIVRRVIGDLISYRTDGPIGYIFRKIALERGVGWRLTRRGFVAGMSRISRLRKRH